MNTTYRRFKNALLLILGICCSASAHGINWNPTPSGTPTTNTVDVYYTNVTNANRLNPWPNGAATSPTYTHHAAIMKLSMGSYNRLYCSFSTHPLAEDALGQWVSMCHSDDNGLTWSGKTTLGVATTLFECPDAYNYESYEAPGYRLQNCGFFVYGGLTYALCQCNVGPRMFPRTVAYFVREVTTSGLGTVYRLGAWGASALSTIDEHPDSSDMIALLRQPENRNFMLMGALTFTEEPTAIASPYQMGMNEPSSILLGNGDVLRLWRANFGAMTQLWTSTVSSGIETFECVPTPIPSAPAATAMLRLSNDKIALCGNFTANSRNTLHLATSNDEGAGFQKLYTVRTESYVDPWWVDTSKGPQMAGGGNAYPAMIENDGKLIICSSYLKQIMKCHIIPVSSL